MYGQALKDIRKFRRLTQWELAQKLGVTPGYICVLEQHRHPQLSTLEKYAAYLKVPVSQVVAFAEGYATDNKQCTKTMDEIRRWVVTKNVEFCKAAKIEVKE
jgi:transcriptional regulator with XRE-family HTH domain